MDVRFVGNEEPLQDMSAIGPGWRYEYTTLRIVLSEILDRRKDLYSSILHPTQVIVIIPSRTVHQGVLQHVYINDTKRDDKYDSYR